MRFDEALKAAVGSLLDSVKNSETAFDKDDITYRIRIK